LCQISCDGFGERGGGRSRGRERSEIITVGLDVRHSANNIFTHEHFRDDIVEDSGDTGPAGEFPHFLLDHIMVKQNTTPPCITVVCCEGFFFDLKKRDDVKN
jgi:hypothetical protein